MTLRKCLTWLLIVLTGFLLVGTHTAAYYGGYRHGAEDFYIRGKTDGYAEGISSRTSSAP